MKAGRVVFLKILYITHVDMQDAESGSSVRPVKMLAAFQELGWQVDLISGFSNPSHFRERTRTLKKWIKTVNSGSHYDFCYIEPPSGPMFHFLDLKLIRLIHKKGIPCGLFYRDAYWKLAGWFSAGRFGFKLKVIRAMQKYQWGFLQKYCDVLYGPTESFCEAMHPKRPMKVLPPAGERLEEAAGGNLEKRRVIYVGQYSQEAGGPLLLEAMELVNREMHVELELVCRRPEFENAGGAPQREWLHVHHISGKELDSIYVGCDLAVIPRKYDFYMSIALPVKLFEYMSHGLPVVAVDVLETSRFIEKFHTGIVCKADAASLAAAVLKMYREPGLYQQCKNDTLAALYGGNLWIHRAEQIKNDLTAE